jgi:hypothetical protein
MKEQADNTNRTGGGTHAGEQGIALILTLGILAVIVLIALGFALSARTELKSSSSYSDMVAAESLAKMGMDRCLMEVAYQPSHQPLSGDTNFGNYFPADITNIDGSAVNDPIGPIIFGRQGDFINLDANPQRSINEPYWVIVTNSTGQIIGRFAYVSSGVLADINAIGNIFGAGDQYIRGNGSIGIVTNSVVTPCGINTYTRGICSDVNLIAFLTQLGYGGPGSPNTPTESARRILCYRYGWPAGGGTPATDTWKPGDPNFDDNGDGVIDDPQEYDPVQPKGCTQPDQAVPDITSLDSGLLIAPDLANTNLQNYATTTSSDPNLTNSFGVARLNINAMISSADVPAVVNMLSQVPLGNSSISNHLIQIALNIIDFHTTSRYPTVYQPAGSTTNFVGVKATPYLNQLLALGKITVVQGADPTTAQIRLDAFTVVEEWNPYPGSFPDPCFEPVTNSYVLSAAGSIFPTTNSIVTTTLTFPNPILSGFASQTNLTTSFSALFPTSALPFIVTVSNVFTWSDFYGLNVTNKINVIGGQAITNAILSITNLTQTSWIVINREADDPRMNILYSQPNDSPLGSHNYLTGTLPLSCNPIAANGLFADTGPREGLASFYVKANDYSTIGEIGYVHRGEPWATIRLQPNAVISPPYAEGNILDYIRVNDLSEVRGRININADTNSPVTGALGSPLLYALFSGITNSAGTTIELSPGKLTSIINEIAIRRLGTGDFTGIGQICGIPSLATDYGGATILATDDADREMLIRKISNLITTRSDSGTTEVIAWGQVIKGLPGKYVTGPIVQIRAKYNLDKAGHLIRITKFQYTRQ